MNSRFMMEDHKVTAESNTSSPLRAAFLQVCFVSLAGGDENQKAATAVEASHAPATKSYRASFLYSKSFTVTRLPEFATCLLSRLPS